MPTMFTVAWGRRAAQVVRDVVPAASPVTEPLCRIKPNLGSSRGGLPDPRLDPLRLATPEPDRGSEALSAHGEPAKLPDALMPNGSSAGLPCWVAGSSARVHQYEIA